MFGPAVCELHPRHPITKDSCIPKAAGVPDGPRTTATRRRDFLKDKGKVINKIIDFFFSLLESRGLSVQDLGCVKEHKDQGLRRSPDLWRSL
ncbi:hypothetical protein FQA47_014413 [Oryzias melastigma]|uniref:Uncharacterized protein n=1 Tax=Oryzias melastigma TaxID=30732 RepID=A0A834CJ34_ORYME|nr:hypothetical protein FQA47_014413 [Oryzias melastigma]